MIDTGMFSLQICGYLLGDLMIETLKVVEKCKIYLIKSIREAQG